MHFLLFSKLDFSAVPNETVVRSNKEIHLAVNNIERALRLIFPLSSACELEYCKLLMKDCMVLCIKIHKCNCLHEGVYSRAGSVFMNNTQHRYSQ